MDNYRNNPAFAEGSYEYPYRRNATVRLGNARRPVAQDFGGADSHGASWQPRQTARRQEPVHRANAMHTTAYAAATSAGAVSMRPSAAAAERARPQAKRERRRHVVGGLRDSDFMRYANDNAFVKWVYEFTHGATRPLFILLVVAAIGLGLYFPVRDLYVAKRSSDILAQQVEIRKSYNESLQKDVDKLLSEDGIKDIATDKLGLVMPGEKKIDVVGLDDSDSSSSSSSSTQAKKSSEVDKAIQKVAEDAPWYVHALDTVFGFTGVEGQTVASNGN